MAFHRKIDHFALFSYGTTIENGKNRSKKRKEEEEIEINRQSKSYRMVLVCWEIIYKKVKKGTLMSSHLLLIRFFIIIIIVIINLFIYILIYLV